MAPRRSSASAAPLWGGLAPGARVFVDSAPFIYLLEDHPVFAPRFLGLFEAAAAGQLHILLSTITVAEVLTGPHKAGRAALAKRYETALCEYEVLNVSVSVAALAAQIGCQYRLRLPDALQLAAALEGGAHAFVTHDRDFAAVDAIAVLTG